MSIRVCLLRLGLWRGRSARVSSSASVRCAGTRVALSQQKSGGRAGRTLPPATPNQYSTDITVIEGPPVNSQLVPSEQSRGSNAKDGFRGASSDKYGAKCRRRLDRACRSEGIPDWEGGAGVLAGDVQAATEETRD
jgi:hypothetical protein